MEAKTMDRDLRRRIRQGKIRREDVIRRLGELAFGDANDCVKLVLEDNPAVDNLDLAILCEIRRSDRGTVEVKLVNRLQALEQLLAATGDNGPDAESFLAALQGGQVTQ